jgi:hypothetical protein
MTAILYLELEFVALSHPIIPLSVGGCRGVLQRGQ